MMLTLCLLVFLVDWGCIICLSPHDICHDTNCNLRTMNNLSALKHLPENFSVQLNTMTTLKVSGDDAASYLHSQLTVNTNDMAAGSARLSAHCDFKGKTWAILLIQKIEDYFLLTGSQDAVTASYEQLKKYGVFSKVEFTETAQEWVQLACCGKQAAEIVATYFTDIPTVALTSTYSNSGVITLLDYPNDCYLLNVTGEVSEALQAEYANNEALFDQSVFEAIAIKNALPDVTGNNINQFVPQMMNVQSLNGIDFNKGCYMGQEVVARTRYLGKNKRAAYVLYCPHSIDVHVGDNIEKQLGDNWRRGGTILRVSTLENETWLLAVLANDSQDSDVFRVTGNADNIFSVMPRPYIVE